MTLTHTGSEWNLLVTLCKVAIDPSKSISIQETLNIDWENLLLLAHRHQVSPLFYKGISTIKETIPNEVMKKCQIKQLRRVIRNMDLSKELIRLAKRLSDEGVEIIPLKGVVLANKAYQDIGAREMVDIDFLFRWEDRAKIKAVLLNDCYEIKEKSTPISDQRLNELNCEYHFSFFEDNRLKYYVEPHWYIGHKMQQINFAFTDIKVLTQKEILHGNNMSILSAEGLLITTCIHHGSKEVWRRLKYVCDIAAILNTYQQEINWEYLFQQTKKMNVTNIVLLGIGVANHFFPASLPSNVLAQIKNKKIQQHVFKLSQKITSYDNCNETVSPKFFLKRMWFHIQIRKNWLTKLRIIFFHLEYLLAPNQKDYMQQSTTSGNRNIFTTRLFRIKEKIFN